MDQTNRAAMVNTVLSNAKTLGLDESIKKFGGGLLEVDRVALSSLSTEEVAAIGALRDKLGSIDPIAAHINNNNNNKEM